MSRTAVLIRAPAKVNLGLEVIRRRRDGYHEIRTLFQAVSLADRVRLEKSRRGILLRCRGMEGSERENLAWRAAELFLEKTGVRGGVSIELEKRIPVGGGLGGGSSDAASVLLGACRLFRLQTPPGEIAEWAAALGSDVPFFVFGGAAIGSGRGERIEPLPARVPAGRVLIYSPPFAVPTSGVYAAWRRRLTGKGDRLTLLLKERRRGNCTGLGRALFNDLERTVLQRYPALGEAKALLLANGAAGAQVSGSGSCLFGIYASPGRAHRAARYLRKALPGSLEVAAFLPPRLRWGVVKR